MRRIPLALRTLASWFICAVIPATLVLRSPAQSINVDFNGTDGVLGTYSGTGAALDSGTIWNAFAVGPEAGAPLNGSITSAALVTSTGGPTPVTVSLGNFKHYEANENPAGLAPALMTDFVYQQTLGPGGPDSTFSINHLDPSLTYDLYFYAQNGGYANTATIFTIGGVSQTATNGGNGVTTFTRGVNYVLFSELIPDGSGAISGTFNDAAPANNAAFCGLQIVRHVPNMIPPSITLQPVSQTVVVGATVTFTVSATGSEPLSFRWSKDGIPIAGQTTATLTLFNVTANDNGLYRVGVANDFGSAESAAATLTVIPPSVQAINVDFNGTDGTFGTFTGTAAAPDTGTIWNGFAAGAEAGPLNGTATSSVLVTSVGGATPVTVSVGNFRAYEANERPAGLATALLTDFVYQQTLGPAGPDSSFSINNLDPLLTYDLYLYAQNGGYANTATIFTIGGVSQTATNAGNGVATFTRGVNYVLFSALVPNGAGTISGTFNDAAPANNAAFNGLQIVQTGSAPTNILPRIVTQPISRTAVIESDPVQFTVGAIGSAPLNYQWSRNGSPLAGETATSLTLLNVTTNDNGLYRVRVSNSVGFVESDPATLAVIFRRLAGIYGTGVDNSGALASDGSIDLHWILGSSADANNPGPDAIVVNEAASPVGPWLGAGPKSKWIAPQPNQNSGNSEGDYTYQTFFDLTGVDPGSFRLAGQIAVDDALLDIVVNGVSQGVAGGGFTSFLPFTLSSGFVPGPNSVDFLIRNGNAFSPNPTGLRVDLEGLVRINAVAPLLSITWTALETLSISWTPTSGSDRLQSAPEVTGPWKTISSVSPTTVNSTEAQAKFFRVQP